MAYKNKKDRNEQARLWRSKNPEKSRAISRKHYWNNLEKNRERGRWNAIRYNYGITREDFEAKLREQNSKCAICGKPQSGGRANANRLHIDHDHDTKIVRELLCTACNLLIANCKESKNILAAAIKYLEKWGK